MTEPQDGRAPENTPRFERPKGNESPAHGSGVAGLVEGPVPTAVKFRTLLLSFLAAGIGGAAGVIAYLLYNLIGLITNLAFYHELSFRFRSPEATPLGTWVILIPVVGGLIVGVMA
jgi:hypothetical protein